MILIAWTVSITTFRFGSFSCRCRQELLAYKCTQSLTIQRVVGSAVLFDRTTQTCNLIWREGVERFV